MSADSDRTTPDAAPVRRVRLRVLHHEPDAEPIPLPPPAPRGWVLVGSAVPVPESTVPTWPPPAVRAAPPRPAPDPETPAAAPAGDPGMRAAVAHALRLFVEVIGGRLPASRLGRVATPSVVRYAAAAVARPDLRRAVPVRSHPTASRAGSRERPAGAPTRSAVVAPQRVGDRICSVRFDQPAPGVVEVAAVCRFGDRFRALAARFEQDRCRRTGIEDDADEELAAEPHRTEPTHLTLQVGAGQDTRGTDGAAGSRWRCVAVRLG